MGLIRKTLAVGTVGVVRPSSKKQRVAKATMKAAQQQAAATAAAARIAEQQAAEEREYRYATDPTYRKFVDDKKAAAEAARAAEVARRAEATRLRRIRNQQLRASAGHGLVVVMAALSMVVLGILVWLPQLVVGAVRHEPADRWMYSRLRAGMHRT